MSGRPTLADLSPRYQAQVAAQLSCKNGTPANISIVPAPARPRSPIRQSRGLNKLEQAFLDHMTAKGHALVREALRFRLANGSTYLPDFCRFEPYGSYVHVYAYEVKATWSNGKVGWREDDRLKLTVAAQAYPWTSFVLVTRDKAGAWHETPISK